MKLPVLPALTALALLGTGCVSTGKYEALQKRLDDTTLRMQGDLDARQQRIQEMEAQLAEEERKLEQLTQQLADAQEEKSALQAELTGVVKDRSRLKGSVEQMQQAMNELEARRREAEQRVAEFRDLMERFRPLIDTGRLSVKIVDGRMVVEMATDVLFASGSARLSRDGQQAVTEVGRLLADMRDRNFQIEGHTDNVPISTAQYPSNWELAAARSITVVKTLVDAGMDPARVSAASFSEYKPTASNQSTDGRARNRRIEIVLIPDLSSLPGFDELQRMGGSQNRAAR